MVSKKHIKPIHKMTLDFGFWTSDFHKSVKQSDSGQGEGMRAMASSMKPKDENNNNKKSNSILAEVTKPEKKASTTKKPNKSKPKPKSEPDNDKNKSSNETLVESEVIAHPSSSTEPKGQENENKSNKNGKPRKRKQKVKVEETEEEEEDEEGTKMCRFPMNRIKRIIKSDDSRMAVSQDVVFLVNKATEKFLQQFCEDGYKCFVKDRKKSLRYKHLSTVVREQRRYDFLSDHVPEKVKAEDTLKERNLTETGAG